MAYFRVAAGCALALACTGGRTPEFSFAVLGDVPYRAAGVAAFPELVRSIEGSDVEFALHIGDIKSGASICSDSMISSRYEMLNSLRVPLVYVPGDNEWTHCHRESAGGYTPIERLGHLRTVFFAEPGRSLGRRSLSVEWQRSTDAEPGFPEHQMWERRGVVFVTLHIVGSANGLSPFAHRTEADDAEVTIRSGAAIRWLRTAFARAEDGTARGVVIGFHGNPAFVDPSRRPMNPSLTDAAQMGFEAFSEALIDEARNFSGPVLVVHGDTHHFRIDRPLYDEDGVRLANVTRLEVFGAPDVGWVEVEVRGSDPNLFRFVPHIVNSD